MSARVSYSANEAKSADNAVPELDPFTYSGAVLYENGPLYINVSYERHEDYFGLSSMTGAADNPSALNDASQDQGIKFGIGYTFGSTTLNFIYEILDYENDDNTAGAVTDYDRDAFFVSVLHKIRQWTVRASYNHADEGDCSANGVACDSDELGVDMYTAGVSYSFSKRTDVYAFYVQIDNEELRATSSHRTRSPVRV